MKPLVEDEMYQREYCHLKDSCYLDQTGAALYTQSQLQGMVKDLEQHLYTNPHSNSLPSKLCSDLVDQVRYRILYHFNTTSEHYSVIFTSGATEALKIVAETFDFTGKTSSGPQENGMKEFGDGSISCGEFSYLQESHTSVLGMRNVDNITLNNIAVRCVSQDEAIVLLSAETDQVDSSDKSPPRGNSLFVYPAQCNFSGVKYPLTWIQKVQHGALEKRTDSKCRWFCLLDAATHVSTNPLDLSVVAPDFVCVSFYKMFGLPTGLGALLVRNASAAALHKRYYGGGTVQVALSSQPVHVLRPLLHERFEDGTINYLSIISLRHGLDWWQTAGLTPSALSQHCFRLAQYTHARLRQLHHANGRAAVRLYADTAYDDPDTQGGIVNFNMVRDNGQVVGYMEVLNLANLHGIHLRTGCFCNPGACQRHLGMTDQQYYANFEAGHVCGDDKDLISGRPTGSVRVSFGPHSRQADADRLLAMLTDCFVSQPALDREPDDWEEIKKNLRNKFKDVQLKNPSTELKDNSINKSHELTYDGRNGVIRNHSVPESDDSPAKSRLRLSRVSVYPVKSCGAMEAATWPLDYRGLRYDRGWMVVTELGTALTQKHEPRMCLVTPRVDEGRGLLTLTCPGFPSCSVPLHPSPSDATTAGLCQSKVCGTQVQAWDCGEAAAQWLSAVLGRPGLRLVRQGDEVLRSTGGRKENSPTALALSNQAQFLLVNENSVNWLSEKLPEHSDCSKDNLVDRFRSNFVIQGECPAFEEQKWAEVKIGSITFKVDGPCGRCQMICIDQSTGEKTKEPLTTLAANCQGSMKFGIYLSQSDANDNAVVKVGDVVTPLLR